MGEASRSMRPQQGRPPPLPLVRLLTSSLRVLPDFIILGGMRCGTSSLYAYLCEHPQILPPWAKEVHFLNGKRGAGWYRAHFPTRAAMLWHKLRRGRALTFEASPYYLVHPGGPRRLSKIVPRAKLIVLVRNPVDRAYSHYQFNVRIERERHSFEGAIKREAKRLDGEREQMLADEAYRSPRFRRYSYTTRGMYYDQIMAYERYFSRGQMLVLKSEDLFERTQETYDEVLRFVGLDPWQLQSTAPANMASYERDRPPGYNELRAFFAPHNQRLYEYLGRDLSW